MQDLRRVAGIEQRPVGAALDPLQQYRQRAAQPDGNSPLPDNGPGFRVHERAAAGREHDPAVGEQPLNDPFFPGAEMRFAMFGKNLRDGGACRALDFLIRVKKRQAELGGQPLADSGLAGAHEADEHDTPFGSGQNLVVESHGARGLSHHQHDDRWPYRSVS